MRWWMRFFDAYFAPSLSMIGWSIFVGPAARQRPPEELRAAIDRIPLESRRIAWRKALFNEFSPAELAESKRRVTFATRALEQHLSRSPWIRIYERPAARETWAKGRTQMASRIKILERAPGA